MDRPSHDLIGQTLLGKLKVLRLLGQGGMGAVYEVEHLITRHRRALKVMHQHYSASNETVARFIREAGVAGTLNTPHVVETYDAGQLEDGAPYVLMELLHGQTLGELLDSVQDGGQRISPSRIVGIVCQVLEGLAVAHEAGVVHRDIKPDNIFVSSDDRGKERVRILDFGISKFGGIEGGAFDGTLTSDQTVMGTPYYMSPEQVRGAKLVDARSDIYSVGVMLFEGLSGSRPYDAPNMAALAIKIHAGEHTPLAKIAPHIAPGLAAIVERSMHHDANRRYPDARALLEALVPFAESNYTASLQTLRQVPIEPVAMVETAVRPVVVDETANTMLATKKETPPARWPFAVGGALVVVLLGGAAWWSIAAAPAAPEPAPAPPVALPPAEEATPPVEEVAAPPPVEVPASVEVAPVEVAPAEVVEPAEVPRAGRERVRRPRTEETAPETERASGTDRPRGRLIRDVY